MIGTRLAHYEIASHLGTGGMGEVYQATDSKLGRSVAIKLLPAIFTHDVERVARFEREARVLASLNQPNIAAIYGVEESAGRKFLVMELVSGETLAEQIRHGPIAVEESMRIAAQIAEALEAAHEKGVVHRDLKPANVKITADGKVKVLDFGLAKAFEGETKNVSLSNSPTINGMATHQGIILGTAAYMSPEQARGRAVDRRTDIFAFGAVLYEMLTADPAFGGEDVTEILGRVVAVEPDWNRLPTATPLPIRRLLRRALKKDPRQRLADIHDARLEIEEASNAGTPESETASVLQKRGMGQRTIGALAAVLAFVALTLAVALWAPWRTDPLKPLARLEVDLGAEMALPADAGQDSVVLSPDGTRLAYIASVAGAPRRLYTRRLDQSKSTELPGTNGVQGAFFSPDCQWIGFTVASKLNKISVEGGAVVPLADVDIPAGAAWAEDDRILMGAAGRNGLRVIPLSGGQTVKLTDLGSGEIAHAAPQFLPGRKFALIAVYQQIGTEQGGFRKAGKPERFFESTFPAGSPEFSPDGRWLAYQTTESGRNEVVVRAFPAPASGQGGKWLVSTNGGSQVRWSRTNRELLYQEGDRIMAVSYTVNGSSFVADKPRVRIEQLGGTFWDVAPDGSIAVLTPVASPQAPSAEHTVVFLENFFDELRRRVPVGK